MCKALKEFEFALRFGHSVLMAESVLEAQGVVE